MINLVKPRFWGGKIGFTSIILLPLSLIYLLIVFLKKITKIKNSKFQLFAWEIFI